MCLLNFLVKERNEGHWVWNESNILYVVGAQQRLNVVFGRNFITATIHKRVRLLKNRWRTFNEILHLSGVHWDRATHMMFVPAKLWTTGNRVVGAYQYEGDSHYDLLDTLFNDPGVEGEFLPAMYVDEGDVSYDMDAEVEVLLDEAPILVVMGDSNIREIETCINCSLFF
ncbi:hypothetical protein ACS0TY_020384 [Phlomoides rotata]